jgi:hypothetical protein
MRKSGILGSLLAACVLVVTMSVPALAGGGFDQYGYNDTARVFNGTGSSWCLAGGQAADCLGINSPDKLVMKWNAAWDACNAAGNDDPAFCLGAWTTNEWNGMGEGGSGAVWHYKIIWVGPAGESSPYWLEGGYSIWSNYEVIMDQGKDLSLGPGHFVYAHATPNGLGVTP